MVLRTRDHANGGIILGSVHDRNHDVRGSTLPDRVLRTDIEVKCRAVGRLMGPGRGGVQHAGSERYTDTAAARTPIHVLTPDPNPPISLWSGPVQNNPP